MHDCEEGFAFSADEPERVNQRQREWEIILENKSLRARVAELEVAIRGLDLESDECNCTEDRRCNRCRALDALHNL